MNNKIGQGSYEKYSKEGYEYYCKYKLKKLILNCIMMNVLILVLGVLFIILNYNIYNIIKYMIIVTFIIVFIIFVNIYQTRTNLKNMEKINNLHIDIAFYNEYLTVHMYDSKNDFIKKMYYAKTLKVIITEQYFIIYDKIQVIPLLKSGIETNDFDTLIQSIHRSKSKLGGNRDE